MTDFKTIRVMTYNVHRCIGMDRRISPERTIEVIRAHRPDIVALQELDVKRKRTGHVDQAHMIAEKLEMLYHFHSVIHFEQEQFGNAILSRFPFELKHAGLLPGEPRFLHKKRGAIWVQVHVGTTDLQFINTHLDLRGRERLMQMEALIGSDWIGHPECRAPVILSGDFNAHPGSSVCCKVREVLRDVQHPLDTHSHRPTWFGHWPLRCLDYIFVSPVVEVAAVHISRSRLDKIASDHLPVIADIRIPVEVQVEAVRK